MSLKFFLSFSLLLCVFASSTQYSRNLLVLSSTLLHSIRSIQLHPAKIDGNDVTLLASATIIPSPWTRIRGNYFPTLVGR
ncbi:hypothetical protein B0H14DRAFT_2848848 [Mycena olivaceomarginata]|nr:hypothetical protein B0H14DRAFT_2848848 [Mycena olivaceomarginata]